jgi:drug/metabolite transporter (DMT)-like permease
VAIALGAIVLHESLSWTIGTGAALVLACVAIVVRRESEVVEETRSVPVTEPG